MSEPRFSLEQVDAAIDYVGREGAQDRGQTKSYSHVFAAASMPPPQLLHDAGEPQIVTDFMKAFHDRCSERGLPPLDALVVQVAGMRKDFPGVGYFKVNSQTDPLSNRGSAEERIAATQYWESQKEECRRWGTQERRAQST